MVYQLSKEVGGLRAENISLRDFINSSATGHAAAVHPRPTHHHRQMHLPAQDLGRHTYSRLNVHLHPARPGNSIGTNTMNRMETGIGQ